jgi:hypothetical protein
MQANWFVSILAAVSAVMVPSATGQSLQPHKGTIVDVQKQGVTTPVKTGWINDDERICNQIGGSNCAPVSTPLRSGQAVAAPVRTGWINDDEKICNQIGGSNCAPVSTPLRSNYYRYNVSVKLDCEVYVGHYVSEGDDLRLALSANSPVPVRLEKHVMYIDFPGDTVQMRIIRREASREGACSQTAVAKP